MRWSDSKVRWSDVKVRWSDSKVSWSDGKVRWSDSKVRWSDGKVTLGKGGWGRRERHQSPPTTRQGERCSLYQVFVFYLSLCFCICVFGQPLARSAVEGGRLFYVEKVFVNNQVCGEKWQKWWMRNNVGLVKGWLSRLTLEDSTFALLFLNGFSVALFFWGGCWKTLIA